MLPPSERLAEHRRCPEEPKAPGEAVGCQDVVALERLQTIGRTMEDLTKFDKPLQDLGWDGTAEELFQNLRKTKDAYHDQPPEIRAFARAIAEEIAPSLRDGFVPGADMNKAFWTVLEKSRRWREVERKASPQSQRKVLEYLYTDMSNRGLV